jgi:uncharacterized protein (TIGR02611 family)
MDEPTRRPARDTAARPAPEPPDDPGDVTLSSGSDHAAGEADVHRHRRGHRDEDDTGAVTIAEIDQAAAVAGSRVEHLVEGLIEAELETGRREETIEAAKRHLAIRIASVVAGVVVLILGIGMLVLPGPGLIVIALGLGLLATEVPFARRLLDKVRARLPQDEDGSLPRSTIIMMVVVGVGAVALSIGFTVWRMSGS